MEDEEKKGDINNNDFLLYYTKYNPYNLVNSNNNNNNDNNNESLELNEDENDNNNILNGRWSQKEHLLFIKGCLLYGNYWKKIKKYIQTRSCSQIRSHAQKYLNKLNKKYYGNNNANNNFDLNLKINEDEIKRLVNKNKFNDKDMDDAELYILSIFKGNKDKDKSIEEQDEKEKEKEKENENFCVKNKIKKNDQKIFKITKINKEKKKQEEKFIKIEIDENNKIYNDNDLSENDNYINEYNNDNDNINMNNNTKDDFEEDNDNDNNEGDKDKKILKENILLDKRDMNILMQKEMFINKCLDSKDPKDLVKLLTFFDNDINFKVNDLKLLKKYKDYLELDNDNSENSNNNNFDEDNNNIKDNNLNNLKNKEINMNGNIYSINDNSNNINVNMNMNMNINNQSQNMYPYLFNPSNNTIQFNQLYNPKLMMNPACISHYN